MTWNLRERRSIREQKLNRRFTRDALWVQVGVESGQQADGVCVPGWCDSQVGQGGWGFFRASEERVICETATRSRFRGGASVADEV